jgi:hypothetical protein
LLGAKGITPFPVNIQFWDNPRIGSVLGPMTRRPGPLSKSVHSPALRAFCDLLIAARRKNRLTQQKVADLLGKPQSFVAKYEGGERRIDVVEFVVIARALREDPIKFLKEFLRQMP